ncbi:MAG: Maf family protein [Deltaproteobacteria bacterium]|jgi:septum formation protein|nr:Maf family protein [Deltaproteobacteria bacterium]
MTLILASNSPRRKELLINAGVPLRIIPADIDEESVSFKKPAKAVLTLARLKAENVYERVKDEDPPPLVLGADTLVYLKGAILGKPKDINEAREMLRALNGQDHDVFTGYAFIGPISQAQNVARTKVRIRALNSEEIEFYLRTLEPLDKAGAYAVQGEYGQTVIERIHGSLTNVIGLPLPEVLATYRVLKAEMEKARS